MLKYIFKKYKIISATTFKLNIRLYQSQKGVYGFRPKQNLKNEYTIADDVKISRNSQCNIYRWVEAHKKFGHRIASIDPVSFGRTKEKIDQINFDYYELKGNENVTLKGIINIPKETETVKDLQSTLRHIYCGDAVSAEFSYIESQEEKEWLSENFEIITQQQQNIPANTKKEIAKLLLKCQIWDNYLAVKFPSVKRYGAEGAENILTFFRQILLSAVDDDLKYLVIAMPHRGRGNLLTVMLNTRPAKIFRKFKGGSEFPNNINAMGDVVSHYNTSEDILVNERNIHVTMLRNPSHLEAVNPVSMGKTRSKQQQNRDGAYSHDLNKQNSSCALNIQLHGDAAFSGQGINQECLMMTSVPHFDIGGTIHMIVNNQIGFTTPADRGRSTLYASDLAKSIQAPVFHVNGDNPEILTLITKLAFNYQRKFGKDIFIDLNCFRRWGHNELDDPTFTNPLLYSIIQNRKSVPDLYLEKLISEEIMTRNEVEDEKKNYWEYLNQELEQSNTFEPKLCAFEKQWKGFSFAPNSITYWDTGLDYNCLKHIGITSVKYPKEFNIHSHLKKTHVEARLKKLEDGLKIDWSTAEALAIGSLMYQGHNVRISGEDVGRGTFSQRHAMLVDQITNEIFIPLNTLTNGYDDGKLEIANSILSEEAVLGYEYGMAIDNPNNLFIWEAQFGDFSNGAQIIIDNFIVSGETKWLECNGLVMLLPHGYDGAGSEHSSCRIERFLQLTDSKEEHADGDDVNLHVINPTTSAQYYHALRRQILRNFRKPLIVVSPKVLLRLSDANSSYSDMQPGTYFRNVIGDDIVLKPNDVTKIILCSGKHYYNLHNERVSKKIDTVAIIRLESLCPFPLHEIQYELSKYKNAKQFIWSQEEARNMGPWNFIRPRFEHLIGRPLKYCGRCEGATAATGNGNVHRKECDDIVKLPFIV